MKSKLTDRYLLFLLITIALCGITAVYTSVYSFEAYTSYIKMQTIGFAIGFVCFFLLSCTPEKVYIKASPIIFVISIAALIAVLLFGIGKDETGGQSWIRIGSIGFQPSEFVKIGFIITFAAHITRVKSHINKKSTLALLLLHGACFTVLVALEPDVGTALVFVFVTIVMLFLAGLSWKYFAVGAGLSAAALPFLWFLLKNYQKQRIMVFLNPELDPMGSGYNVIQSKQAVMSGGIFGQGFLNGSLTQSELLPSKHTDFIFSVIGEEFGIIGCALITLLLMLIILRIFTIGCRSASSFSGMVSCGLAAMMLFHTFINIGMCMGLMPVTGIPLPFISYGGSSVVSNFAAAGIASGFAAHKSFSRKARKK